MLDSTYRRAKEIIENNEAIICPDSHPPNFFHFMVKQRDNHGWADVWLRNINGVFVWNCGAIAPKKNGKGKWGCVMNIKSDKTRPFCSHTMACDMLIKNMKSNKTKMEE